MDELEAMIKQVESRPTKLWWFKKEKYPTVENWPALYNEAVKRGYDATLCETFFQLRKRGA